MLSFHQAVQDDFDAVNGLIIEQLHSRVELVENIGHYIVEAGGKRLRPLLVLLIARSLGYQGRQHIDLATIIEFIHTATLLHDDVVDLSLLRRNRPTANAKWGNAPSVLVGDFLYSRAFQMLVSVGSLHIMQIMSDATNTIAEGEVLQLVNAGNPDTSEANYLQVIHFKTACLFEAAAQLGAIVAGGSDDCIEQCRRYAYHLGMAFQLIDDALDYSGSSDELGKNVGDDLAEGKPTLPLIYILQHGNAVEKQLVHRSIVDKNNQHLAAIIAAAQRCGALDYTHQCAQDHVKQALAAIATWPGSPYTQALQDLAHFALARKQ